MIIFHVGSLYNNHLFSSQFPKSPPPSSLSLCIFFFFFLFCVCLVNFSFFFLLLLLFHIHICTPMDKFSVLKMSKSELQFLVKDDKKEVTLNILMRSTLEYEDHESHGMASSHDHHHDQEQEEAPEDKAIKKEGRTSSAEFEVNDDINDGFRTPTSLDHKIPVTKQCPPAPRKSKPLPSKKRKGPSTSRRNLRLLDLSNDVELLFPPPLLADIGRKMKKARKEDTN